MLIALFGFLLAACNQSKQPQSDDKLTFTEEGMVVEASDTLAVNELVNQFMELILKKEYYQAAGMLYKADVEKGWEEPQMLENEEIKSMAELFQSLPIHGYKIDYIKFSLAENNEVKCTIDLAERVEGAPAPPTTAWYFKPVRYLATWKLCMKNSGNGDKPLE